MTTREEFEDLVEDATKTAIEWWCTADEDQPLSVSCDEARVAKQARFSVMDAWDALVYERDALRAEVERLRAEVETLRDAPPLVATPAAAKSIAENIAWRSEGGA